jgi:hypothetical protein
MQAATGRVSAVLSVKETESIRAAEDGSSLATSFATTFGRFAPLETRINTGDLVKSETAADNKRHTNAHRPPHLPLTNWEYNPSSSATAQKCSKHAAIYALLLLFVMFNLFRFIVFVYQQNLILTRAH